MDKESIMKRRLQIGLIACCITLFSIVALAGPGHVLIPYGVKRTYFDHPTNVVVGEFVSCGEYSYGWGQSFGYSYYDQSIECP